MSDTLVLVFREAGLSLADLVGWLAPVYEVTQNGHVLSVRRSGSQAYVVCVNDVEVDAVFDDWPEEVVPDSVSVFSLDYRDALLAAAIVHTLADGSPLLIDTNQGLIVDGQELDVEALRTLRS